MPTNVTKLRGFLGTANQLFHFILDGAQIAEPLRQLTQIKSAFIWGPDQEAAFQSYKNALHHELILYHFNPKFKTVMITDASRIGLGFILFQVAQGAGPPSKRLIQCGSRSVSGAESRYAVCELEGLAICWAVQKCRHYLAGMPLFHVCTDHRSLVHVFEKNIADVENPRLRSYREKL